MTVRRHEPDRPLWRCPACGRSFASVGQVHTCRALRSLDEHLDNVELNVRATFDAFVAAVRALGPVEILPQASRIAFHKRMSFAVLMPRRRWLNGHLVLAEHHLDPRFTRVTTYSPRNHVHEFRLTHPDDIDDDFHRHLAAAYEVGRQTHHQPRR
ncbi:MAG: DUF5655 domain-containing protein [Acidimicrobiales bacterium]